MGELTIEIPEDTIRAIDAEARAHEIEREQYIREAIDHGRTVITEKGADREAGDDQPSGAVENLKERVAGLGRQDETESGVSSLTGGVLEIGGRSRPDPDERSDTVEKLKRTALEEGVATETREEAIEALGSIGPEAENALAELASSDRSDRIRQLALGQIRAINEG